MTENWIPKAGCVTNVIYWLDSRNLPLGWWTGSAFEGPRWKYGPEAFLSSEDHWDDGPPYGTAKPLSDSGEVFHTNTPERERLALLVAMYYRRKDGKDD